jgi:hypothetical protein
MNATDRPASPRLERREDGQLWLLRPSGERLRVRAVRCFPWSAPDEHVSLRDDDDEEVALVGDPTELEPSSRDALSAALREAGLVFRVSAIVGVEEDFELRLWKVHTEQGLRSFQTALDAWPRSTKEGGLLLEDVQGDLYAVPPPERLDAASRRRLWAFLD